MVTSGAGRAVMLACRRGGRSNAIGSGNHIHDRDAILASGAGSVVEGLQHAGEIDFRSSIEGDVNRGGAGQMQNLTNQTTQVQNIKLSSVK